MPPSLLGQRVSEDTDGIRRVFGYRTFSKTCHHDRRVQQFRERKNLRSGTRMIDTTPCDNQRTFRGAQQCYRGIYIFWTCCRLNTVIVWRNWQVGFCIQRIFRQFNQHRTRSPGTQRAKTPIDSTRNLVYPMHNFQMLRHRCESRSLIQPVKTLLRIPLCQVRRILSGNPKHRGRCCIRLTNTDRGII